MVSIKGHYLELHSGAQALITCLFILATSELPYYPFLMWGWVMVASSVFQIAAFFKYLKKATNANLNLRHQSNVLLFITTFIYVVMFYYNYGIIGYTGGFATNALMTFHCSFLTMKETLSSNDKKRE